jgi:hypothetical protein
LVCRFGLFNASKGNQMSSVRRTEKGHAKARSAAGLPGAPAETDRILDRAGIDADRLSIAYLGPPGSVRKSGMPPWAWRAAIGSALWLILYLLEVREVELPDVAVAISSLIVGLVILQAACQALVTATESFAARMEWTHYVSGTVAEILATLPELVVIAFVIPVSPLAAFLIAMVTIYSNALVFSVYSYFLPRDRRGKYLMPAPITQAGTQVLIAGGALGLVLGLVMVVFTAAAHPKVAFDPIDLASLSAVLLVIFGVYFYKLVGDLSKEEADVEAALGLTEAEKEERRELVYDQVGERSMPGIFFVFAVGVAGAFLGGERVAVVAQLAIGRFELNGVLAALILAGFAGMSEYVILWTAHRKQEYGIALANAFGGIVQLMFLIVPFTFGAIAFYQSFINPAHPHLPIAFSVPNILLMLFLFPTLHTLAALLENDHTLGILDTVIMVSIVGMLILLLVTYGGSDLPGIEVGR